MFYWNTMESTKNKILGYVKTVLAELATLDKITVFETFAMELYQTAIHALLPAIFCTVNSAMGYDSLFPLWLMAIVVAYIIHKKQLAKEGIQGLCSGIAMVRFVSLLGFVILSKLAEDPFKSELKGFTALNIFYKLSSFQVQCCQNIALYRIYLSIYGVLVFTAHTVKGKAQDTGSNGQKQEQPIQKSD